MKFKISSYLLILLITTSTISYAQLASGIPYLFSVMPVTPPVFPSVGAINIILPQNSQDEWDTLINPSPPFSFNFAGIEYTKIVISSNGWLALMPSTVTSIPASIPNAMPDNNLSNNTTGYPIVAPLWDDLSTSLISYSISPANTLWIRWTCKWDKTNAAAASSLFWIKLDGNDGTIAYHYANNVTYIPSTPSASIGIAGVCPNDFYSAYCTSYNNAFVDSVIEDTAIGGGVSPNMRPYNCSFVFTPFCRNDSCVNATYIGINQTCVNILTSTIHATASAIGNCSTTDVKDVWYKIYKPVGDSGISISTRPVLCNSVTGTSMEVWNDCAGSSLACATTSISYPDFARVDIFRSPAMAETLYVRVTADADIAGKFEICASLNPTLTDLEGPPSIDYNVYVSENNIYIDWPEENNESFFQLHTIQGQSMSEGRLGRGINRIDLSAFSKGIYVLKISTRNALIERKIVIPG
jgi:hypothetical protein